MIYISDFETVTENTNYYRMNKDSIVLLACSAEYTTGEKHLFTNIKDWLSFHINIQKSHIIYFHNLSWDGEFILRFLANYTNLKYDYVGDTKNPPANSYRVFRNAGRIYYIHIYIRNRAGKRYTLEFKCSYRLLNSSVGVLGKSVNIAKHLENDGQDFYDVEPEDKIENYPPRFIEYIKNDCEIVRLSLLNFETALHSIPLIAKKEKWFKSRGKTGYNVLNKLTSASTSKWLMWKYVKQYRNTFKTLKNEQLIQIPTQSYLTGYKWFKGGFTQINEKYLTSAKNVEKAIMIDVTSAYPYQMTFDLPYGEILNEPPTDGSYVTFYKLYVESAKIKKDCWDCVCLYNWKDGKDKTRYTRESYDFECFYTKEEWDCLKKFYDFKVSKLDVYYMKSLPYLKDYATDLFALKNYYASIKNSGLKQAAKIMLNAGYGCLAERLEFKNFMYFPKEMLMNVLKLKQGDEFSDLYEFHRVNETFNFAPDQLCLLELYNIAEPINGMNVWAAATITSRQRVYLLNKIYEIGAKHFALCDTDSILFINLNDEQLAKIKQDTSSELGGWEIESEPVYFGCFGAKKYVLKDKDNNIIKSRFAGIDEKSSRYTTMLDEYDFSQDEILIKDAVMVRTFTKNGIILTKKDKINKKGTI